MERLLCDSEDIDCIRKERDNLDVLFNSNCSAAGDYGRMVSEEVRKPFQVKIEVIDVDHQKLSARIQDMFETKSSTTSMKSRALPNRHAFPKSPTAAE